MTRLLLATVLAVVGAGALGGDRAALLVVQVVAVLVVLVLAVQLPAPGRRRRATVATPDPRGRFPSYERALAGVAGARRSPRLVDLQLRPLLQHVVSAAVEDRGPEAVRRQVGEDVWALVDPARPASDDSSSAGLDLRRVDAVLTRLESL